MRRTSLKRRLRSWARRQLYSLFSSLGSMISNRMGTLMTVVVLGIAMALPLGLYVTVINLQSFDLKQSEWGSLTAFLDTSATEEQALSLASRIESRGGAVVRVISPQEGMAEFTAASGFSAASAVFDENPLPWVFVLAAGDLPAEQMESWVTDWQAWLESEEVVELVQVDMKWMKRLSGLLALGAAFISVLSAVFAVAVIVVVSNTIRLDVANRAEEIQVLSMVGASNGFIRQPFLYSGFWYGMLGAGLALAMLQLALFYLHQPIERLLAAYGSSYDVRGLGVALAAAVLLGGGVLGLTGAWLAVQRHLRALVRGEAGR